MFCRAAAYIGAETEGSVADGMRAGRLKIRRYKTRRWSRGLAFLLVLALFAGGAAYFFRSRGILLPLSPSPTLTPEESAPDSRTVTLPGQTWFALQLGVFEQKEAASALAESYRARGAGGYVLLSEHYRVLAACYETRADAQAVQTQLRSQHQVDAYVYELSRPEILLKLSGQKAQLTALTDAWDALDKLAAHLSSLSQALDQRAASAEAVLSAAASEQETAAALATRLRQLFGDQPHTAVAQVIQLLDDLSAALAQTAAAANETRLGAQIKYCHLLCVSRMSEYAAGLSP